MFLLLRAFGIQQANPIVSHSDLWSIMPQYNRNWVYNARESRRTWYFAPKMLNFFMFQSKVKFKKGEHRFIEISSRKMCIVWFIEGALDGHDDAKKVGYDPTTRIPLFLDFDRLIFIGESSSSHVSICDSPSTRLNHNRRISLTRSTALNYARVLIAIRWTEVHKIYVWSFTPSDLSTTLRHIACKSRFRRNLVPHGSREQELAGIKDRRA